MEVIRTWILSVTVSAIVIAAAEAVMPAGPVKKVGRLIGGLILVLGVMQPLVTMDYEDLYAMVNALPANAISQEQLEQKTEDTMKGIIEEELAAYIVDKAAELGAACTAEVTCAEGENGVPTPVEAVVTGPLTPAQKQGLIRYLDRELGIAREYQRYQSEELS